MNLSIIIPAYNSEKYIGRCLDSVLKCPLNNYEIVIVNDGSNDNTLGIINKYIKKTDKILLVNQKNQGVSAARNTGILHSNNEYLLFLDSDDTLIEKWWEHIPSSKSNLIIFDFIRILNGKKQMNNLPQKHSGYFPTSEIIKYYILTDRLNSSCGKLYKKTFIDTYNIFFPTNMHIGEDAYFVGEVLKKCETIEYCKTSLFMYEDNKKSATNNIISNFDDLQKLYDKKKEFLKTKPELDESFHSKFLGDYISDLRYATKSKKRYISLIRMSKKIYFCQSIDKLQI